MIPKTIHYCWFGGNPLPADVKKYIATWKGHCPEYEIVEWNESNFDIHSNRYVEQAYEAKKWAFVSDYVRLYAIYNYGGIYMDTDVEVLKPLDDLLDKTGFTGFETANNPLTGIVASEKENSLIGEVLETYRNRDFILQDGSFDMTTNIVPFREVCLRHNLLLNGEYQEIDGFAIFPKEYFCPYDFKARKFSITAKTHTIHHFAGSWLPKKTRLKHKIHKVIAKIVGPRYSKIISRLLGKPVSSDEKVKGN